MAINNPIIDAGPTIRKVDTPFVACPIIETEGPPPLWTRVVTDGVLEAVYYDPQWQGQMIFTVPTGTTNVVIYIAVETSASFLEWKEVSTGVVYEDPRTGKEKDPTYDLYFPSAS